MPKIKNMGTATMRFGEGVIVTGSAGTDAPALVVTGSTVISGSGTRPTLDVYGSLSGQYVAVIDNDQNSSGHVLKLLTDGNGSGSRVLEMIDGDGDTIFRARADGRFGFGPDGVSSMGAGTFVVGIDNSSHTADIAISQRLQHLGDSNTYLDFPSNDNITFAAGGSEELKIASDAILVKQYIKHVGDENTWINFTDNRIRLNAGGNNFIDCEDPGSAPHKVRINNGGNNIDFVIKDNSNNVYFTADASEARIGVGTTSPIAALDVSGSIAITSETTTPSQPADGQGYLYAKSDGKLYWRSYDVAETDLTAAGGGGSGSPGGSDTHIQINNGGSFGGVDNLTYDGDTLFISGSMQLVGEEKINDPTYAAGNQANRSFTLKRHYNFSIGANTVTDVISWRPYLEGGTTEPSHFHGVVAFKMEILGHQNGVANGYRSRKGIVSYEGSSAANAFASDDTLGSGPITAIVNRSGWVATLQINANSSNSQGFRGSVYVEVHFARGAGTNGEGIYWSIT